MIYYFVIFCTNTNVSKCFLSCINNNFYCLFSCWFCASNFSKLIFYVLIALGIDFFTFKIFNIQTKECNFGPMLRGEGEVDVTRYLHYYSNVITTTDTRVTIGRRSVFFWLIMFVASYYPTQTVIINILLIIEINYFNFNCWNKIFCLIRRK